VKKASREIIDVRKVTGLDRYQLLTSLVVPRPIGWISTRSRGGLSNLAPFSYFSAVSASPMLVSVSIGMRRAGPKDTLRNIREHGGFCVNVVTEENLDVMVATSVDAPADISEFASLGLEAAEGVRVDAPYVADCAAVLECRLYQEVDLGEAPSALVIGEVEAIHLSPDLPYIPGSRVVDPEHLRTVSRLGGDFYGLPVPLIRRARPVWED